ncbi:Clr5 domain-containing protein, partial [Diplogelasinospora grovesii]
MDEENHILKQSPDWADSQRWERYRGTIQELYHSRNLPLKEVMKIMEQEHQFRATPRMYKMRFKAWGLDKNFKEAEVVELYRLRRERTGKPTIYTIRGREVDWDKVQTYVKRKGLDIPQLVENAPPSPTAVKDVAARTPSPKLDSSDSSMPPLPKPEALLPPVNTIRQPMAPVNTIRQPIAPLLLPPSSPYRAHGSHNPGERAREYGRFLRLVYDMILDEDEDKRWGTTEYWRRNDRSQGWMMTVRYKLAMHRDFLRIQALKGDSAGVRAVRRFRTLNRSFALLEPVSRSIIGSRMFYMLNFVCAFG